MRVNGGTFVSGLDNAIDFRLRDSWSGSAVLLLEIKFKFDVICVQFDCHSFGPLQWISQLESLKFF